MLLRRLVARGSYSLTAELRLSTAAAAPVAEHGFQGTWASVVVASVVVAAPRLEHRLDSYAARA